MNTRIRLWTVALVALLALMVPLVSAQELQRNDDDDDYGRDRGNYRNDRTRIDRYLDAELWTNHSDDEFYIGDNVVLNYRVNDDAFVAIYSVDTRGRVRLLFPSGPNDDNFIRGGVTYRLPGGNDDYDLSVTGPEGVETIQIIASRERFPIPDWYRNGLVADASERDEYMDYLNSEHFVRYGGQRFAYDRARIYVNEWEPDYFRPIYHPVYPHWSVCGNAYFDYPWGASIYIDGIYWGCTPLYVPTILVGWHTVTVYDPWGYCWEDNVNIMRHHTVVLDRTVIVTRPSIHSRYKEVRAIGYRDPEAHGYPKFKEIVARKAIAHGGTKTINSNTPLTKERLAERDKSFTSPTKRYAKSIAPITKTDRGYEAKGVIDKAGRQSYSRKGNRTTDYSGSRKGDAGSYNDNSGSNDADKSGQSTYGSTRRSGSKQDGAVTHQTESGSQGSKSGYEYKRSEPSTSGRSEEKKQTIERTVEKRSDGGTVNKAPEKKSGDADQSKRTEAKSKSDGNAQPQQAPAKNRDSDTRNGKGRR